MNRVAPPAAVVRGPSALAIPTSTPDPTENSSPKFVAEVVALSLPVRVALWLLLFVIIAFNAALLIIMAVMYHQSETTGSLLWVFRVLYLSHSGNMFVLANSRTISIGYAVLAGAFCLYALQMIWASLRSCRLGFGAKPTASVSTRRVSVSRSRTLMFSSTLLSNLKQKLGYIQYLVGVRGPYFEYRQVGDDLVELVSQTAAAYASSLSLSNVALNVVYGIVIFLTTIMPIAFKLVFPSSVVKQRMACLVADLVLDFVWGSLLPIGMYLPLIDIYRTTAITGTTDSFANSAREIERVLVLSWKTYLLSVMPFIITVANIAEIQSVLREVKPATSMVAPMIGTTPQTVLKITYDANGERRRTVGIRRFQKILPLYGVLALVVTLVASRVFTPTSDTSSGIECLHPVYPWFTSELACAGRRVNCTTLGIAGTTVELEPILHTFHARTLDDLFLVGCPSLQVPASIHRFETLQSLIIKDSVLVQWDESAAVTVDHYSRLGTVHLSSVLLALMPTGLLTAPLPPTVEWIHLVAISNATELLAAAGSNWASLRFFDCMYCGLQEFPATVKAMASMSMLFLGMNEIAVIPDDWITDNSKIHLDALWLDGNWALTSLPDNLWRQAATCEFISMTWTSLMSVPEWLAGVAQPEFVLVAGNTPLCANPETIPATLAPMIRCETYT